MKKVTKDYSRNIRPHLYLKEWTAEKLRNERQALGLTLDDIGNVMGVTGTSIWYIEAGKTVNPWAIQMYGIILERYKAYVENYIPTYRKAGAMTEIKDF